MTPHTITLVGAKGGSGTSTVAAALALHLAKSQPVDLVDQAAAPDLAGLLGMPSGQHRTIITPALNLYTGSGIVGDGTAAVRVIDAGTDHYRTTRGASRYLVTRECYLSLRRASALDLSDYAGLVLVQEPGRALGASDVAQVLGLPIAARIPIRSSIARAIDAGVLATRLPETLGEAMARLVAHEQTQVPA